MPSRSDSVKQAVVQDLAASDQTVEEVASDARSRLLQGYDTHGNQLNSDELCSIAGSFATPLSTDELDQLASVASGPRPDLLGAMINLKWRTVLRANLATLRER